MLAASKGIPIWTSCFSHLLSVWSQLQLLYSYYILQREDVKGVQRRESWKVWDLVFKGSKISFSETAIIMAVTCPDWWHEACGIIFLPQFHLPSNIIPFLPSASNFICFQSQLGYAPHQRMAHLELLSSRYVAHFHAVLNDRWSLARSTTLNLFTLIQVPQQPLMYN